MCVKSVKELLKTCQMLSLWFIDPTVHTIVIFTSSDITNTSTSIKRRHFRSASREVTSSLPRKMENYALFRGIPSISKNFINRENGIELTYKLLIKFSQEETAQVIVNRIVGSGKSIAVSQAVQQLVNNGNRYTNDSVYWIKIDSEVLENDNEKKSGSDIGKAVDVLIIYAESKCSNIASNNNIHYAANACKSVKNGFLEAEKNLQPINDSGIHCDSMDHNYRNLSKPCIQEIANKENGFYLINGRNSAEHLTCTNTNNSTNYNDLSNTDDDSAPEDSINTYYDCDTMMSNFNNLPDGNNGTEHPMQENSIDEVRNISTRYNRSISVDRSSSSCSKYYTLPGRLKDYNTMSKAYSNPANSNNLLDDIPRENCSTNGNKGFNHIDNNSSVKDQNLENRVNNIMDSNCFNPIDGSNSLNDHLQEIETDTENNNVFNPTDSRINHYRMSLILGLSSRYLP
ncbi:uncharacterized protein TRIADDRAFT_62568 [Trichoplax adhaerens]|uniref:Uncharacterized protein n=1 Tax=Trichoplax adhaerens TaxID=10228 RepID=B3SE68_TRIAD|nr:hypothetical protein TRIADDRAFT_62568 [Trichoplax adhaerens]EDV18975.1 hypothetical protein TRIADDRAFT_62568 [Trichoplax adhaerens]|eukprot:XP_002118537.1 hypothetical protein TRIADDRAFT_62568 [Trichoplax adhaerens]